MMLKNLIGNTYGQGLTITAFICSFLAPLSYNLSILGILVLLDLFWGVRRAILNGGFFCSWLARETIKKTSVYATCVIASFMIESMFHDGITIATVVTALACACELWSISASMLMVFPDMPFLSMFRKYLKKEMRKKADFDLDELG